MIRALLLLALLVPCLNVNASNFPRPVALEPAVQFWIKVYTRISTNQGYVHDDENLSVIYETVELPAYASRADRDSQVTTATRRVTNALNNLAHGKRSDLSAAEAEVLAAWPPGTSSKTFAQAAQRVRFQLGQSDRFREGLVRSGQWRQHIRNVLAEYGLPRELEVLPHVESSFNPAAYSKAAAAGMWQFMPATARQYMRVDQVVDERMDPFIATEGAAKLLKTNYEITGTWPLALTSYNHGASGMVRAAKAVGTTDIDVIVDKYKGEAFGFASRNFYASFLAVLEIDSNPGRYFGRVKMDVPTNYDVVAVRDYVSAKALAQSAGISVEELKAHNPALRDPVWNGDKYIPRGYPVRVPIAQLGRPLETALASLSSGERLTQQKPDRQHVIAPGDSLSSIARRYGTSVSQLMAANGLRNQSIRTGKTLILPGKASSETLTAAQVAETRARLAGKSQSAGKTQSAAKSQEYVIRSGDSLWSIARRFKVSQQQLLAWNDLPTKHVLRPGQKLKVASAG
jgi:membrane-bound lytic murein transglycosylase D